MNRSSERMEGRIRMGDVSGLELRKKCRFKEEFLENRREERRTENLGIKLFKI